MAFVEKEMEEMCIQKAFGIMRERDNSIRMEVRVLLMVIYILNGGYKDE